MKQCCLCGKSGHESSECGWYRAVPMSKVGHATFRLRDEVLYAMYKNVRAVPWYNSNQS